MKELDAHAVAALLAQAQGAPTLLDVREPWEWEFAHIDGALHVPMGQVPARIGELDRDAPLVVICHHGGRSRHVAGWLEAQGFADVSNFDGGIDAWSLEIDPSIPRY